MVAGRIDRTVVEAVFQLLRKTRAFGHGTFLGARVAPVDPSSRQYGPLRLPADARHRLLDEPLQRRSPRAVRQPPRGQGTCEYREPTRPAAPPLRRLRRRG